MAISGLLNYFVFLLLFLFCIIFSCHVEAAPIVKITNFSSNTLPEWIEIHNETAATIDLTNWKIGDSNSTVLYDINLSGCLSPNSYLTIYQQSALLNNDGDTINLYNSTNELIDQLIYTDGKVDNTQKSDNSCVPSPTPTIPSPTPLPSNTSTPTHTPTPSRIPTVAPTSTSTPSNTNTPTRSPTSTPIPTVPPLPTLPPEPTAVIEPTSYIVIPSETAENIELNDITISPTTTPRSSSKTEVATFIPFIFMAGGGLLLIVPFMLTRIKK